jgi:hypothetical protein
MRYGYGGGTIMEITLGPPKLGQERVVPVVAVEVPSPVLKAVRFTGKVRRGLALARSLVIDSLSDDAAPPQTTVRLRWTATMQDDFNAAMRWMEQKEDWENGPGKIVLNCEVKASGNISVL